MANLHNNIVWIPPSEVCKLDEIFGTWRILFLWHLTSREMEVSFLILMRTCTFPKKNNNENQVPVKTSRKLFELSIYCYSIIVTVLLMPFFISIVQNTVKNKKLQNCNVNNKT